MSRQSKSWYLMDRPLYNSGTESDEFYAYGADGFREILDTFIASDVQIFDKAIYKAPKTIRAIIQNVTSDTVSNTTIRQILCEPGNLRCGQYVKHRGLYWLVAALPDNNGLYEKAVLWKCKHTIRFKSPKTGLIVEYPVYSTNSTQYGTGEDTGAEITVGEDQHLVYIPYNDETIMLDNGFRFIMDKNRVTPSVYYVTRVDPVSYAVGSEIEEDGLIQFATLQTQLDTLRDSVEYMVADYYEIEPGSTDSEKSDTGRLILTDLDGDYTVAVGETKEIEISGKLLNGTKVDSFDYTLTFDMKDGAAEIVSNEDYSLVLKASYDVTFIGEIIQVHAESETLGSADMTIQIVNW